MGCQCIDCCLLNNLFIEVAHLQASDIKESLCLLNIISSLITITTMTDFVTIETLFQGQKLGFSNPTVLQSDSNFILQIGSDYQDCILKSFKLYEKLT